MPIYSHSQLSVYEECPLKYKLQYLDKLAKEEVEGIEGFMGNRVHETLKKCYDDLKFTRVNALPSLLAFYEQAWQKNWHEDIVITKADLTADNYRALGARLLENYYRRYAPFDRDATVGTEMLINFPLDGDGKYRLRGYIDRLAKARDGAFEIHDYKTSSSLPAQEDLDSDRQLALYNIGVRTKWPHVKNVRLVWHYLAFDTEMVSTRSEEALSEVISQTTKIIDQIESATEYPAKESWLCNWCEFPGHCPNRKHVDHVTRLPVNEYLNEPGVALVNQFAYLKDQENRIGAEIEKVREAIIEYARRNGMTVLQGSDRQLKVRSYKKLKFPAKTDAVRDGLERMIMEAGKWDEVSQLDTAALARVCEDRSWNGELIEQVMNFGRIEETTVINLSRQRGETFRD